MGFYIKKAIEIEAVQWTGDSDSFNAIQKLNRHNPKHIISYDEGDKADVYLMIPTLEGNMKALIGDWVIKGVNGEIYPCKPDIFEKTYEELP